MRAGRIAVPALATLLHGVYPFGGFVAVSRARHDVRRTSLGPGDLDLVASDVRLLATPADDAAGYVLWGTAEP